MKPERQEPDTSYRVPISKLKQKDEQAWEEVINQYGHRLRQDLLFSFAKRGLPLGDLEDVEQQTWETVARKIGEFEAEDESKFYFWVRVIGFNLVRNFRRSLKEDDSLDETTEREAIPVESRRLSPVWGAEDMSIEDQIIHNEEVQKIIGLMEKLPEQQREMVVRRFLGETPQDMADDDKTARQITIEIHRALTKMRKLGADLE